MLERQGYRVISTTDHNQVQSVLHDQDTDVKALLIGLAPDGGRLPGTARAVVEQAIRAGLHIDSGLHDFLSDDPGFSELARRHDVTIRDVRRPRDRRRS